MKCSKLRRLLADGGPGALADHQKAEDHLIDCSECYAVLEAMAEVDRLLPELMSHDATDEVVEQLLARPELTTRPESDPKTTASRFTWFHPLQRIAGVLDRARQARLRWGIIAVPAVILIGFIAVMSMHSGGIPMGASSDQEKTKVVKMAKFATPVPITPEALEDKKRLLDEFSESDAEAIAGEVGQRGEARQRMKRQLGSLNAPAPKAKTAPIPDPSLDQSLVIMTTDEERESFGYPREMLDANLVMEFPEAPPPPDITARQHGFTDSDQRSFGLGSTLEAKQEGPPGRFAEKPQSSSNAPVGGDKNGLLRSEELRRGNTQPLFRNDASERELNEFRLQEMEFGGFEVGSGKAGATKEDSSATPERTRPASSIPPPTTDSVVLTAAQRFLDARSQIDGLTFREGRGYWANTYVPGDRTLRQLKARLDRAQGAGATGTLHDGSRQISQPFDAPDTAALAVYLHADRRGVTARERMLVQVGIKATPRRSGVRPAMNVGLVLDLRGGVDNNTATALRALLTSFAASSELGDRISLTVAGRPGGTILPPGDLRHGPLTVAMGELFGDRPPGPALSFVQAAAAALATVRADDDPNAALGSSAVIIITAQSLSSVSGRLASMAHESAIDGVPWSVIGVGQAVNLAELDALVLAGQGNRRLLTSAADAESLVDRELAAVSRVVARAVRLRIRLAPGVQLVDVIGSERLDERRAQQVRDAEQAVDQRLSRNLGIQTDRGLDEDGIQIVIPSFYADDAHVVLLDVVVPGPGPVADVSVRYKDLVHMKNGVAHAHLRVNRSEGVNRSESGNGPLERNVLANLIATEVASRLDGAADALSSGNVAASKTIIGDTLSLVQGIIIMVDGLSQDPDLSSDIDLLTNYLQALSGLPANDASQLRLAADSLRYAGRLKILPPPAGGDESVS